MKYLRQPKRVDQLRSETRPKRAGRVGRYVYIALLGLLGLFLFDMSVGHLFYLKADGMLMRNVIQQGSEYIARVDQVVVKQGDTVATGTLLAKMSSQAAIDSMSNLSAEIVKAKLQLADMRTRFKSSADMQPMAKQRLARSVAQWRQMDALRETGIITTHDLAEASSDMYAAKAEASQLEQERKVVESELPNIEDNVHKLEAVLAVQRANYGNGELRSPADGTVAETLVESGTVVQPGAPIVRIYHGDPFILGYIPTGTLYTMNVGDEVVLRNGFHVFRGRLEAKLPVAYAVPDEFRKAFEATQREQLVRITLPDKKALPPLFSTLEILSPHDIKAIFLSWFQ